MYYDWMLEFIITLLSNHRALFQHSVVLLYQNLCMTLYHSLTCIVKQLLISITEFIQTQNPSMKVSKEFV